MPRLQRVGKAFDEEVAEGRRDSLANLIEGLSTLMSGSFHEVHLAEPIAPFAGEVS